MGMRGIMGLMILARAPVHPESLEIAVYAVETRFIASALALVPSEEREATPERDRRYCSTER